MSKLRASIIEIFSRAIKLNSSDKVYTNDIDNLYPERIEGIINNSPTAYKCADILANFVCGQGLVDETSNVIVNKKKDYKITDVIRKIADSVKYHNGYYLHFGYGADFVPNQVDVLTYKDCRISKIDDNGYSGKVVYKDWKNKNIDKRKTQIFYPYNANKDVILAQMKADSPNATTPEELVRGYSGQVLYVNFTPQFIYSLPLIDSVYNDADTEYRLSLYVNGQMRNGFMDQTVLLTHDIDEETDEQIKTTFKGLFGAENNSKMAHFSIPQNIELDKVLFTQQIPSSFKPELLDKISAHLQKNITGVYKNVPGAFVGIDSQTLFGDSSAKFGQMKDFYSEQTAEYRKSIESAFKIMGLNIKINPISSLAKTDAQLLLDLKLKGQNEIRSSVGGVTTLVTLVQEVAAETLDLEAAVNIVIEFYGFDEITARKLIGTPKIVVQ